MNISAKQLQVFDYEMKNKYFEKIRDRFSKGFPELTNDLGDSFEPALKMIINYSSDWKLIYDDDVITLAYFMFSYESKSIEKPDRKIVNLMTWPGRNSDEKLKYLHHYLIEKHYASISATTR
jgi:hypothetical protein